jgi:23S rRNA (guanosine2251-2'-O)-methyltransferase
MVIILEKYLTCMYYIKKHMERVLILNDIRSVINVGAIFRTADAVGVTKIYLTGYTPGPLDRFNRKRRDFSKAALGSENSVKWERVEDVKECINRLQKEGFEVVALEQSENSIGYKDVEVKEKTSVIVGNEVSGVSKDVLDICDVIAEIPMVGEKESLNVSVATGVFLFRLWG